ncbi:hypothetical protein ACQR16_29650 [Bradyrhizobium oligotrophicum]|uniref:hypothetical protein n=1 Tax=Bradyrhizobium oligotrophicum TaxID=44255 RepID=UPI003EBFD414
MTEANQHRRRMSAGLPVMLCVALCASIALVGPTMARDQLQREELEAWWSETQAGKKAAKTTCAASTGAGCSRRHGTAQSRNGREGATVDRAPVRTAHRARVIKRGSVAANARAEARDSVGSDAAMQPRRDRPGRYFLHGPRF